MKKNILLVFTGGTIGSQLQGDTIDTNGNAGFTLLRLFGEQDSAPETVAFRTRQPLQILSENLHPRHWRQIITCIEAENLRDFDGIIVTHGTDSLAFSAAALSLYFHGLTIPLLLVSSDLPLDNPSANGVANFLCAVDFIRRISVGGVFVPYRNPGQSMQVHLGSRLSSCLPLSSDFISVQSRAFMRYENGEFTQLTSLPNGSAPPVVLNPDFSTRILLIRPYPGLDYAVFDLDNVDVILHDLYHSGTACVSTNIGERHSLIEFARHCASQNRKLYLAPAMYSDSTYASTRALLDCGAEMIWNLSLETAYAKLLLAYDTCQNAEQITDFLKHPLAWELVAPIA